MRSSGSLSPHIELPASDGAPEYTLLASSFTSDRRGPVGEARALSSAGLIFTPAFASNLKQWRRCKHKDNSQVDSEASSGKVTSKSRDFIGLQMHGGTN